MSGNARAKGAAEQNDHGNFGIFIFRYIIANYKIPILVAFLGLIIPIAFVSPETFQPPGEKKSFFISYKKHKLMCVLADPIKLFFSSFSDFCCLVRVFCYIQKKIVDKK